MEPQVLYTVEKNGTEEIRFSLTEYRGRKLVDVRVFYQNDEGEWLPTKKGVSASVDLIEEIYTGVSRLREALK